MWIIIEVTLLLVIFLFGVGKAFGQITCVMYWTIAGSQFEFEPNFLTKILYKNVNSWEEMKERVNHETKIMYWVAIPTIALIAILSPISSGWFIFWLVVSAYISCGVGIALVHIINFLIGILISAITYLLP